jgi:hypothetical protein
MYFQGHIYLDSTLILMPEGRVKSEQTRTKFVEVMLISV